MEAAAETVVDVAGVIEALAAVAVVFEARNLITSSASAPPYSSPHRLPLLPIRLGGLYGPPPSFGASLAASVGVGSALRG